MGNGMIFPWPDPVLSPNKRHHRLTLIGIKQRANRMAFYITRANNVTVLDTELKLTLVFYPPDKRKRDLDNLYATFKTYQDGMFEALGVDDSRIDCVILRRGAPVPDGKVWVEITEA